MSPPFFTGLERHPRRIFRWLLAGGLLVLAVLDAVLWFSYRMPACSLQIEARSTVASQMQLYYDTGQGIAEARSVSRPLTVGPGMQTLRFPLPASPVRGIRLDPLTGVGTITVRSISVVRDRDGAVLRSFEVESLESTQEIAHVTDGVEGLEIETVPDATDPQLSLPLHPPLTLAEFSWERVRSLLVLDGLSFAAFYSVLYLATFGWPTRPRYLPTAAALLGPIPRWFPNGWAVCLFALPVACIVAVLAARQADSYYVEIAMTSDRPATIQFYFDGGKGYREENSTRVPVGRITASRAIRAAIPVPEITAVRFDPAEGPVAMRVNKMSIRSQAEDWLGERPLCTLDLRSLWPAQAMKELVHEDDGTIRLLVEDGATDPITTVNLTAPLSLGINARYVLLRAALLTAKWLALWIVGAEVGYLLLRLGGNTRGWAAGGLRSRWGRLGAVRAVWVVAGASALLSCYPVVFCGKSFASPNFTDDTFQLYGKFPTLPGTADAEVVNGNGADVSVMAWQAAPSAVVESRAVWGGEWPLWNRYNYAGLPLLGQGQSMFGDPLHLVVLAAGGRAWGWDMKFVLAKALFCAGVGLLVLRATGSLGAGCLLCFSSGFLGFFVYRLNHPAVFSLCYAPWILLAWVHITHAPHWRDVLTWAGGGVFASLCEANSGSFPEAFALVFYLNACGLLLLLLARRPIEVKVRRLFVLAAAAAVFTLLAAMLLAAFFDLLKHSVTGSATEKPYQLPLGIFVGLFDDIFYRQLVFRERVLAPSTNFLVLVGVALAMSRFKRLVGNPLFTGIFLSALLPAAVVFGVLPLGVTAKLPLGGDILQPTAVYSSVLIVHLLVLAGFGFQQCLLKTPRASWWRDSLVAAGLVGVLFYAFYISTAVPLPDKSLGLTVINSLGLHSPFFRCYVPILLAAALLVPPVLRRLRFRGPAPASVLLLALCLFLLHWRQGIQLRGDFGRYTAALPNRLDLLAPSPTVKFLGADHESPFRAAGLGNNLHGGYGALVGVEGIGGFDALQSPYFNEIESLGLQLDRKELADRTGKSRLIATKRFYDLLNVRYLAAPSMDSLDDVPGLRRIGRLDLDVYRNTEAWPRAFFTDHLEQYEGAPQFAAQVMSGEDGPFATIERSEFLRFPELAGRFDQTRDGRTVVPAAHYRLTNNRTSFEVQAPRAGIIVLSESYFAGNVSARLNGRSVRVLRVNHAFRGIVVDAPGLCRVTFACQPVGFGLMLAAKTLGWLILAALGGWLWRTRSTGAKPESTEKLARPDAPALEQQAARARDGGLNLT